MSFDLIAENKLDKGEKSQSYHDDTESMVLMFNTDDERKPEEISNNTKQDYLKSLPLDDIENRISLVLNNDCYRKLMSFCEKRIKNAVCVMIEDGTDSIDFTDTRPLFNEYLWSNSGYKVTLMETHILRHELSELLKDYKRHNWRQDKKEFELDDWTKEQWIGLIKKYSDFCKRSGGYYIY